MTPPLLLLLLACFFRAGASGAAAPPDCAALGDGAYPDESDCAGYYECAGGVATEQQCPWGLFFNSETSECDWPLKVSCQLTMEQVEALRLPSTIYLYYTIDDFPSYNYGSDHTLDACVEANVPVTFMANSEVLTWGDVDYREEAIVRALLEGHLIGDHSYDHMSHNNPDGGGQYDDVEVDVTYFGQMNLDPILDVMERYGFSQSQMDSLSEFFLDWARLPNDNNWRVADAVHDSCQTCAPPATSSLAGIQVADALWEEGGGTNVVGWDLPFFTDYANHRYAVNATRMIMTLLSWPGKQAGKLVILDHTFMHDFDEEFGQDNYDELVSFFSLAKEVGFVFRQLDTYLTD